MVVVSRSFVFNGCLSRVPYTVRRDHCDLVLGSPNLLTL